MRKHTQRWFPVLRSLVALGLVHIIRNRQQLRVGEIIREPLPLGRGPRCCARLPRVAQGHHVVDVDVAGRSPGGAIVRAEPRAAGGGTGTVGHDTSAIALEDCLAGVAGPGDGDPVGEEVAGVAILGALRGDGEAGERGLGGCGCGDVGGSAGDEGRGREGERDESEGDGRGEMHDAGLWGVRGFWKVDRRGMDSEREV